ncbi:MAG TPA: metal ABC transporter ATP-binding protein [Candidatus Merdenecus merdavium]|nr:metal ABC transporter ATP-binding protein [Candidatus Merdenecus merdavium]
MKNNKGACGLHCIKINHIGVTIGEQVIVDDVNVHIHCGKLSFIIGKNGAGKSTLLKAILDEIPHTGTIEFRAHEDGKIEHINIGYVPQHINIDRHTPTSVYDLIAGYHTKRPVFLRKTKKIYEDMKDQLRMFGAEDLIDKQVGKLSGGEIQRVLLSMAIMDDPNLLILDEPVSGIDKKGMDLFYKNVEELITEYDLAILLVSHDLEYVAKYADEVILLDKKILKRGTAKEVFQSKEFASVFGSLNYDIDKLRKKEGEKTL